MLLTKVVENVRDKCIEINDLDPAHFYTSQRSVLAAALKMTNVKLELITDIDILITIQKELEVEFVPLFSDM